MLQALLGLCLLLYALTAFRESLLISARRSLRPSVLIESYSIVLKNADLRRNVLIYGLSFACMFTYIAGAANAYVGQFGFSETNFSIVFALSSMGIILGAMVNTRLVKMNLTAPRIIYVGLGMMLASVALINAFAALQCLQAYILAILAGMVIFSFGLIAPSLNHEALRHLGHVAGVASAVMRCVQMLLGAAVSAAGIVIPKTYPATSNMGILMLA